MNSVKRPRKVLRKLVGLVLLIVIGLIAERVGPLDTKPQLHNPVQPGYYRVSEFNDGDTISVDMNGTNERVRLIGVDTPETQDPRKPLQCFGQAAANFIKQLIDSQPVRLVADPLNTNRDRYERLLRYAYLPDGRLVNAEIIKEGYGFAYLSFPFTKADEFRNHEKEAREASRGLWQSCSINQHDGFIETTPQL